MAAEAGSGFTTGAAGGNGGVGTASSITGSSVTYAGGGGDGTAAFSHHASGAGGSGIVIIAYPNTYTDIVSFSAGLVVNGVTTTGSNVPPSDIVSRAGYKIYKFTSGTGTVTF